MLMERPRMERGSVVLSIVALATIAGIALGGLAIDRAGTTRLERPGLRESWPAPTLTERLTAVDAAIAGKDQGRAIGEWRDAYGVALGSRRWDAMADVGDAAVRIDTLVGRPAGNPTGFRAEARQAYLRALFQARHQHSSEGIERVAQAFAALGDQDMAARARAIGVAR
jgi:hypothetical protein